VPYSYFFALSYDFSANKTVSFLDQSFDGKPATTTNTRYWVNTIAILIEGTYDKAYQQNSMSNSVQVCVGIGSSIPRIFDNNFLAASTCSGSICLPSSSIKNFHAENLLVEIDSEGNYLLTTR
jgi:hypothetical protein